MTFGEVMKSSASDNWATPVNVFKALDQEFHFETDVCADASNTKCANYFTEEMDGLKQDWRGVCWMNPPYGRHIGKWVQKAYESAKGGAVVVCLLPARTDTRWWRDYCMKAGEIRLISGRLKFGDAENAAPFPSAVVIFGVPFTPRLTYVSFEEDA